MAVMKSRYTRNGLLSHERLKKNKNTVLLYWNLTLKLQIIPQLLSNLNPKISSCPLGTHCSVLQRALTCLTTATSQSTLSHPSSPCYHFTFQRTLWQGGHLCEDSSVLWFFFPRVSTCLLFRWELLTGFVTTLSGVDLAPLQFPPPSRSSQIMGPHHLPLGICFFRNMKISTFVLVKSRKTNNFLNNFCLFSPATKLKSVSFHMNANFLSLLWVTPPIPPLLPLHQQ